MSDTLRVDPFGDAAVLVRVDSGDLPARAARAAAVAAGLAVWFASDDAWGQPVPGIGGVLVPFDPARLDATAAADAVRKGIAGLRAAVAGRRGRTVEIPVQYGGDRGPDLAAVAAATGVAPADVVRAHGGPTYDVLVLGFLPGFAYLGPLVPPLAAVPRRPEPRTRVVAGSVALAGGMTAVYPVDSPGGWQVIGWTDTVLWDPAAEPPNALCPGDRVRFVPLGGRG